MILILVWSLRIALTAGLSGLLLFLFHRRSATQRNQVLRLAFVVAWLLPIIALFAPRIEVPQATLIRTFSSPGPVESQVHAKSPTALADRIGTEPNQHLRSPAPIPSPIFPWALVYGLGVGVILLRWTAGIAGLRRLRLAATATEDPMVWRTTVPVPATYGRVILVPVGSENWPKQRIHAAILHERAHIRRGDWFWQTFAGALAVVHWFNPAVWILLRLMRDSAETAADDAVLACGLAPSDYARELIAVAAMAAPVGSAVTMARRGGVKDRVASIVAVTRDRRPPTRRSTALLAVVLAVSGVAVAGLAKRAIQASEHSVRVVDIRQLNPFPSARWNSEGLSVATPSDVAWDPIIGLGYPPQGQRRVEVRVAVDGFVEGDAMRVQADKPTKVVTYGAPHGNGQPSEGPRDGAMDLVLQAPPEAAHGNIRVGRASGAYHVSPFKIPFTTTRQPISWPEGTFPGAKIDFTFPPALKDLNYRVFVVTDKGRVDVRDNEYDYTDDEIGVPKTIYIAIDDPAHVRRVAIETRSYKVATFDIPLVPQLPLATPSPTESKHTIELIRVSEGDRAWLPDGSPAKPVGTIASRYPAGPGKRKLTLAFRVRGETWFKPSLAPSLGEKYPPDGDWSGFMDVPGRPNERIGVVTMNVSDKVATSPITVVLKASPWEVHADWPAVQAHLVLLKKDPGNGPTSWSTYSLTLDGVRPLGPDRLVELALLDQDDQRIPSLIRQQATKDFPSYTVLVQNGKPVRRVILESQAVERARFQDVHLTPSS